MHVKIGNKNTLAISFMWVVNLRYNGCIDSRCKPNNKLDLSIKYWVHSTKPFQWLHSFQHSFCHNHKQVITDWQHPHNKHQSLQSFALRKLETENLTSKRPVLSPVITPYSLHIQHSVLKHHTAIILCVS